MATATAEMTSLETSARPIPQEDGCVRGWFLMGKGGKFGRWRKRYGILIGSVFVYSHTLDMQRMRALVIKGSRVAHDTKVYKRQENVICLTFPSTRGTRYIRLDSQDMLQRWEASFVEASRGDEAIRARIELASQSLAQSHEENQKLNVQLAALQLQLSHQEEIFSADLTRLREDITRKESRIENLQKKLEAAKEENKKLSKELSQNSAQENKPCEQCTKLGCEIDEAKKRIAELSKEVEASHSITSNINQSTVLSAGSNDNSRLNTSSRSDLSRDQRQRGGGILKKKLRETLEALGNMQELEQEVQKETQAIFDLADKQLEWTAKWAAEFDHLPGTPAHQNHLLPSKLSFNKADKENINNVSNSTNNSSNSVTDKTKKKIITSETNVL